MRNSRKFMIGLGGLAIVIAAGMYFSRTPKAPAVQPSALQNVRTENTNRPIVHAQRPSAPAENDSDENIQAGPSPKKIEKYLPRHNRDASSLLAAFHSSPLGERSYLYEAATN